MKNFKVTVRRKDGTGSEFTLSDYDIELRKAIAGYKKKEMNLKEICERLNRHGLKQEQGGCWSYETLQEACERLNI